MSNTLENITETIKENAGNFSEVIRDRLFSPMYFYFIIAWIITNWKFVYAFLNTDEQFIFDKKGIFKIEYLESFYDFELWNPLLWSICKLFLIPAVSTFIVVWWLSRISEKFYKKNHQYKQNKRVIKRKIEYEEEVIIAREERTIRDAESDKKKIKYENQSTFNEDWDMNQENNVIINGAEYKPSEALYAVDYDSYKSELLRYKDAYPEYNEGIFS